VLSVKAGVVSSALLLKKLGTYSRRNHLYQAFAELGRVIRNAFLLEYLNSAQLREQITASTNKVEAYHRFANWLFFGGEGLLLQIHPDEREKRLKYNHLLTNAVPIQNVLDLTRAVRGLQAEGYPVKHEDLATLSPHQTRHIKRFGDYVFTVPRRSRSMGNSPPSCGTTLHPSRSRPHKRLVAYFGVFWHIRGSGQSDCRPGKGGQRPPRVSSLRPISAWAERNPNARRAINRTLVLSDSTRPLLTPCSRVPRYRRDST
jgi:Tn3 transposase DDE domain